LKDRESAVLGNLVDQVCAALAGVTSVRVNDRGSDDFEVFCRIRAVGNTCVICTARLNRHIETIDGDKMSLKKLLDT